MHAEELFLKSRSTVQNSSYVGAVKNMAFHLGATGYISHCIVQSPALFNRNVSVLRLPLEEILVLHASFPDIFCM